ncbi:MAG TPA: uroporphyrinogen decarboxylase family protein [Anaerolineaceae bacterium]|nr:uroporphyrinogen decarboxylase family protein [Anaerolineaceae bacterium]
MMPQGSNHRNRLERCLSGELPDRVPVALWRHFPVDDQDPYSLIAATIGFQQTFDFDLVKVTPTSSFCLKDWGSEDRWNGNTEGTREYTRRVIQTPEDWLHLHRPDPQQGSLGAQLEVLNRLVPHLEQHTPVLQTIFSPLAQAKNLVGGETLLVHLRKYPGFLHEGLRRITETTLDFLKEAIATGISGVFYAVQHAQYGLLSQEEYIEFGKKYDLDVLNAVDKLWLNMLHLHGVEVMFDAVQDYPIQMINWHDRETAPNLAQAAGLYSGVLCGGLSRWNTMVLSDPAGIRREAQNAIEQTGGRKFILGTGCVLPIIAPHGNILAARRSVEAENGPARGKR